MFGIAFIRLLTTFIFLIGLVLSLGCGDSGGKRSKQQVKMPPNELVPAPQPYRTPDGKFARRPVNIDSNKKQAFEGKQPQQTSDKIQEVLIQIALELARPLIEESSRRVGDWLFPSSEAPEKLSYPVITKVEMDSLAAKVGIRPEDILVEYNGVPLYRETYSNDELKRAINASTGRKVSVKLIRDGKYFTVEVAGGQLLGIQYSVYER